MKRTLEVEARSCDEDLSSIAPPRQRPKREIQIGCVLIIQGVPEDFAYEDLREICNEYGDVRFLELLCNSDKLESTPNCGESMHVDSSSGDVGVSDINKGAESKNEERT